MKNSEASENTIKPNNKNPSEKEMLRSKEKIDSWIDDIIKQHKKRK